MSEGDAHRRRAAERARDLGDQPGAAARVAALASERAERFRGQLGDALDDVRTLSRLVRAWARGQYPQVPVASIVAALAALVYFLMPLDAVPDFIAGLGLVDDVAVIARVVHHIRGDLAQFRAWEARGEPDNDNDNGRKG